VAKGYGLQQKASFMNEKAQDLKLRTKEFAVLLDAFRRLLEPACEVVGVVSDVTFSPLAFSL
jgi:hypothetical protein